MTFDPARYPHLLEWAGPRPDGLWTTEVGADALDPAYLADLDRMFRDITIAAPPGWEEKKRVFQRDVQADGVALRGIYLELVLGVTLIRAGVPLVFPARPDIVVNGALGLEATAIKPEFSYGGERPLDAFSREVDFVKEKIVLTAESKQLRRRTIRLCWSSVLHMRGRPVCDPSQPGHMTCARSTHALGLSLGWSLLT